MDHAPELTATQTTRTMTWDEWLAWAPDSRLTEWVDGEVIEQMPISETHDAITRWLVVILQLLTKQRGVGQIRVAPSVLKLSTSARGREPDLMFISEANRARIHNTYVEGPIDAVFEIVSPESIARDRGDKFVEYEAEGITEYWLIDPLRQQIELYHLGGNGRYQLVMPTDGKLHSAAIPGFYLRPAWLWSDPLADELQILRELGVL